MSDFDETSGIIACPTPWGRWWQTMEEVYAEVMLPEGTSGREITCTITAKSLKAVLKGNTIIEGNFPGKVKADDSVWTIEDKKLLRICLPKVLTTADQCWTSLLDGQFQADPHIVDEMQKKLTLQRYQFENPGMDFSNAEITGNYHKGGPPLPNT